MGLLNIQLLSAQHFDGVRQRNMAQARSVSAEVESFLLEVRSDLQFVAQTIASGSILQPNGVDDFVTEIVLNSQFFESVYLLDNNHQILHLGVLSKLKSSREDYARLDLSAPPIFHPVDEISKRVWSNTFFSLVAGEPSVTLGLPMPQSFLLVLSVPAIKPLFCYRSVNLCVFVLIPLARLGL